MRNKPAHSTIMAHCSTTAPAIETKKIKAGRYEGMTYDEVAKTDISYCRWVVRTKSMGSAMRDFKKYLAETGIAAYPPEFLRQATTAKQIIEYAQVDPEFQKIIAKPRDGVRQFPRIKIPAGMASATGTFINYHICYHICMESKTPFHDNPWVCASPTGRILTNDAEDRLAKYAASIVQSAARSAAQSVDFEAVEGTRGPEPGTTPVTAVVCNPNLGGGRYLFSADTGIIVGDRIYDFRASKVKDDFTKLIIYATMRFYNSGHFCPHLIIFNPVHGSEITLTVTKDMLAQVHSALERYGKVKAIHNPHPALEMAVSIPQS